MELNDVKLQSYPQGGYYPSHQQMGYPPPDYPQGPYYHQPAPATCPTGVHTVVINQPISVQQFRETPVRTRCPHCQAEIVTETIFETGTLAWIACCFLFLFGCDAGCCVIPFFLDGCKDVVHSCPNCQQVVSRYNRI